MAKKYDRLQGGKIKPIQLLPTPEQRAAIRRAAAELDRPMTHFILAAAVAAAEKILKKSFNTP